MIDFVRLYTSDVNFVIFSCKVSYGHSRDIKSRLKSILRMLFQNLFRRRCVMDLVCCHILDQSTINVMKIMDSKQNAQEIREYEQFPLNCHRANNEFRQKKWPQ
jgi:hypothetical protein